MRYVNLSFSVTHSKNDIFSGLAWKYVKNFVNLPFSISCPLNDKKEYEKGERGSPFPVAFQKSFILVSDGNICRGNDYVD